jgi:single-stranded DNA-binding protein
MQLHVPHRAGLAERSVCLSCAGTHADQEEKARVLARPKKGVEVYIEGRLTMNPGRARNGQQRTGLSVSWQVMPLGQLGPRKHRLQSRDEQDPVPEYQYFIPSKRQSPILQILQYMQRPQQYQNPFARFIGAAKRSVAVSATRALGIQA